MEPLLNLRDLLQHEIEDLYSAEEQIIAALPKMVEKAADRELKATLTEHLNVTRQQKTRLNKVKDLLGVASETQKGFLSRMFGAGTKCKGTEGLIKEGEKMMGEDMDPKVMDAAIIAACQKIEHYEIAGYGTARAYAVELGLTDVASLLETTLQEEYKADDTLTTLAKGKVNVQAQGAGSGIPRGLSRHGEKADNGLRPAPVKKSVATKGATKKGASQKGTTKKGGSKKAATKTRR